MVERITDKLVKELVPPETGNRIVYDEKVKGFGLRVTAGGAKSFVLNYRNAEGRERRLTIGTYGPDEWSVEGARRRAGEIKRQIIRGEDPLAERVAAREAPTVADLADRYIEDHLPRKRPLSQRDDKAMIAKIVRPKLGTRKVAAVFHADIDKLHRDMKVTPYRANRVLALLSKMFNLAIRWGLRTDNPATGVERFPEDKRTRYLSAEEIGRLTRALAEYQDERAANVVRLCLLTGCRRGEALSATWGDLDLDAGVWTKPGATTKQKTVHRAPLGEAAVLLLNGMLAAAPRAEDGTPASRYVFPGKTGEAHLSEIKDEWEAIRKAAGITDVRLHDLRHTYASILASAGASLPMIGALLGHTQPSTTARYTHLFDDPLRKMADTAGHVINGIKPAEVVPIRKDGVTS